MAAQFGESYLKHALRLTDAQFLAMVDEGVFTRCNFHSQTDPIYKFTQEPDVCVCVSVTGECCA